VNNSYGHITSQPIHFTKWSNTSYAVFNSLGRVVHIGFLSSIIHGLSTVKALISHEILMLFELINDDKLDEDILYQLDPIDLFNIDELIASEYRNHSTPFSSKVSENIKYKYYVIIKRPFSGLFSFARLDYFKRDLAFFLLQNQLIKTS